MGENNAKVPGWGMIIAILIAVGIVAGLLLGLIGGALGLSPTITTGGVGVTVGVAAATLIGRRRAALESQKNRR